jgi:hypothetical protein
MVLLQVFGFLLYLTNLILAAPEGASRNNMISFKSPIGKDGTPQNSKGQNIYRDGFLRTW